MIFWKVESLHLTCVNINIEYNLYNKWNAWKREDNRWNFLMKYLKDSDEFKDKKIGFVVPQTSLRKTLKGIFKSIYGLKASDILGPVDVTKQNYDILLVDEAHRLHQYKNISYRGSIRKAVRVSA